MSERERFEAWARQRWTHPEDFDARIKDPGKYNNYEAQAAWEAWQEKAAQNVPSVPAGWLDAADLRALQQGNSVWLHTEDQGRMIPVYLAAAPKPEGE